MIEKLSILLLGWLLGLLGPAIVDAIRRNRENALGRAAILSELHELGNILALAAFGARSGQGKVDRGFLLWLKRDMEAYATSAEVQEFIPKLTGMLAFTDAQFQEMNSLTAGNKSKGTVLQHYSAPLLDSRVSALWSFETTFQRQLLEIRQSLVLLDDLVDRSRTYFDLTFTKLEGGNFDLVHENFAQACDAYAGRAQRLVSLIRALPRG